MIPPKMARAGRAFTLSLRIARLPCIALLLFVAELACSTADGGAASSTSIANAHASVSPANTRPPVTPSAPAAPRVCQPACSSLERCESGGCVPNCPKGEVFVSKTPAEGFSMGNGKPGEYNQKHTVVLTRPFCMDETEVTVAAYRACVDRGACTKPEWRDVNSTFMLPDHEQHPVNMVTWDQSLHYCKLRGQDLPTEAQFEWAAGQGKHRYPWGDEDPTCANELADFTPGGAPKSNPAGDVGCGGGNTSPVKAHPKGKTSWPGGDIFDLGGNVWEWTKDCAYPYAATRQVDPYRAVHPYLGDHCYVYSLRGGGWNRSMYALRVYYRGASRRTYHVPGLGFRCVRNPSDASLEPTLGNEAAAANTRLR